MLAVGKIGIVASTVEVQVGWPLVLPAAVWDNSGVLFDNCSALPIEWESSDATGTQPLPIVLAPVIAMICSS